MLIRREDKVWPISVSIGSRLFRVTLCENVFATEKDFNFLPHNHSGYELQLFTEGSCRIHTHMKSYVAEAGDICITHPYEYHTFLRPLDENSHLTVCSMNLTIEKINDTDDHQEIDLQQAIALLECNHKIHDSTGKIATLFSLIQAEFDERKPGYLIAIKGLVTTLLVKLFQLLLPNNDLSSHDHTPLLDAGRTLIIERFFLFNYHLDPSINDLAKQLYLSPRRVNQIINQMYACSFSKKLVNTRLEVAKFLLLYSEYSTQEIGFLCGFNSLNYFYTSFRKETGLSPHQFRKEAIKDHTT